MAAIIDPMACGIMASGKVLLEGVLVFAFIA